MQFWSTCKEERNTYINQPIWSRKKITAADPENMRRNNLPIMNLSQLPLSQSSWSVFGNSPMELLLGHMDVSTNFSFLDSSEDLIKVFFLQQKSDSCKDSGINTNCTGIRLFIWKKKNLLVKIRLSFGKKRLNEYLKY